MTWNELNPDLGTRLASSVIPPTELLLVTGLLISNPFKKFSKQNYAANWEHAHAIWCSALRAFAYLFISTSYRGKNFRHVLCLWIWRKTDSPFGDPLPFSMEMDSSGSLEESVNCDVTLDDSSVGITSCSVDPAPTSCCCCSSDVVFWGWWEFAPTLDCSSSTGPLDCGRLVQNMVVENMT